MKERGTSDVIGVIYMDSPDAAFFSDPTLPRADVAQPFVAQVAAACTGLAAYAELRYPAEARSS